MKAKTGLFILILTTFTLALGAVVFVRIDSARLRGRMEGVKTQQARARQLREENQKTKDLLSAMATSGAAADQAIHAEVLRMRNEVRELERQAEAQHRELTERNRVDTESLANNRDPEKGLVRLENLCDAGQATPSAALQAIAWAAFKGNDARIGELSQLSPDARERANELIAALPDDARARWTPEKLAALSFTGMFSEVTALQITGVTFSEPDRATVVIRVPGTHGSEPKVTLQSGPTGWQVVVNGGQIDALRKKLHAAPMP